MGHQPILLVEKAPIFTDLITKMNDYWPGDSPNMDIFVRCVHQFPSLAVNDMNCPYMNAYVTTDAGAKLGQGDG